MPEESDRIRATRLKEAIEQLCSRSNSAFARRPPPVDVAAVRIRLGMTQEQFAARVGIPVATLRHWERGNRKPRGAALVLLTIIDCEARAVLRALKRSA